MVRFQICHLIFVLQCSWHSFCPKTEIMNSEILHSKENSSNSTLDVEAAMCLIFLLMCNPAENEHVTKFQRDGFTMFPTY